MSRDGFDKLVDLFDEALQLDESERRAWLDALRVDDADLAQELEGMLRQQDASGVLDAPIVFDSISPDARLGTTIGPYRIDEQLGMGGMGVVYDATQQSPVRRRVALKLIRVGMNHGEVLARFDAERRALAMMDHPSIARVYDAGTTDEGLPYFAMEYVAGLPINQYCDQRKLGLHQRLELFVQLCLAIQHAHQKGVIHRDLKPSNVLVTEVDGVPTPRVIDFGVARAIHEPLSEDLQQTRFGQVIGTPEYMSPEQAEAGGLDVDTRADVYSLAVILYELLTGSLPISSESLRDVRPDRWQQVLQSTDPATPSQRVTNSGEAIDEIVLARRTTVSALRRDLAGDLDWIVMKGLESDRTRRYESASGFADDVRRYLSREPVLARPPSKLYRASRFVSRHRVGVFAATVLGLGIVVALAGVSVGLVRAQRALQESETMQQLLVDAFSSIDPNNARGRDTTLMREVLEDAEARIESELADYPESSGELYLTLAGTYRSLGLYEEAASRAETSVSILSSALGEDDPATLTARGRLGLIYWDLSRVEEAEAIHRAVYEKRRRIDGEDHVETLRALNNLSIAVKALGDLEEAGELTRRCLEGQLRTVGDQSENTLTTMGNLARIEQDLGRHDEAERLMREVVRIEKQQYGEDHPRWLHSLDILGGVLASGGQLEEAESVHRRAYDGLNRQLGERHPTTLGSAYNLGKLLIRAERFAEAETILRSVYDIVRVDLGETHRYTRFALNYLAESTCSQPGREREGLSLFERSQQLAAQTLVPEHPDRAKLDLRVGECLLNAGETQRAERQLSDALAVLKLSFEDDHESVQRAERALATARR